MEKAKKEKDTEVTHLELDWSQVGEEQKWGGAGGVGQRAGSLTLHGVHWHDVGISVRS